MAHTTQTTLAAATATAGATASRWTRLWKRAVRELLDDRVPMVAASVAFYALMAFFPAVAAFIALYGLFADVSAAREHLSYLRGFLPPGTLRYLRDEMIRVTTTDNSKLGATFFLGILFSLWSANAGVKSLVDALNLAYEEKERRSWWGAYLISLVMTVGAMLLFLTAFAMIVAIPVVQLELGPNRIDLLSSLRWPLMLLGSIAAVATVYRYAPSHRCRKGCKIVPGSIFAGTTWLILSLLLSWYVTNLVHYDKSYGSLGGVLGLMIWMWLGVIVVLLGAELNSELERP